MPDSNDIPRRRSRLLLDVTTAASEVSRLVHEAHDLNLPVEPGVRPGRDSLVRWAVLLEEVIPKQATTSGPVTRRGRLDSIKNRPGWVHRWVRG
jgi:hypothetical protein